MAWPIRLGAMAVACGLAATAPATLSSSTFTMSGDLAEAPTRVQPPPRAPGDNTTLAPTYAVDPAWPQPLPNRWILGAVVGVAVYARHHVWITHRQTTLQPNETRSIWKAAPPVLEFDAAGA